MNLISRDGINQLRQDARSVVRELGLLSDAFFDIGVTLAERHLLIELANGSSLTAGEIAEQLLLDKSTISRLLSKVEKKGYVISCADAQDKRKRGLQLTGKGRSVLNEFEQIAFDQTKGALHALSPEEVATVYQGVALYAKGLERARLQEVSKDALLSEELMDRLLQLQCTLGVFRQEDEPSLCEIFREVVESGSQFPYECTSLEEFRRQFLNAQSTVYVCRSSSGDVIGCFYLRANFSGRSAHIANAAYMLHRNFRGKGIGKLLVEASLHIAKEQGFQAMQFNMVLSQNDAALRLYKKLEFSIVGTITDAYRNPDGSYQDSYIMYRKL